MAKSYVEVLKQSKEKSEQDRAEVRAAEMQKAGEMAVISIQSSKITVQSQLADATTVYPLNFANILALQDKLQLLERQENQLKATLAELFPTRA